MINQVSNFFLPNWLYIELFDLKMAIINSIIMLLRFKPWVTTPAKIVICFDRNTMYQLTISLVSLCNPDALF